MFRQIIANAKIEGYIQIFCFMGIGAQRGGLQLETSCENSYKMIKKIQLLKLQNQIFCLLPKSEVFEVICFQL